jgi:hypothetical protein
MLKYLPILAQIWQRSKRLEGMFRSHTTRVQGIVLTLLALFVSSLGFFVPSFASREVEQSLFLVLLAVVGTFTSRLVGYRDPDLSMDVDVAGVFLLSVRHDDLVWHSYSGSILDACLEGWHFGIDVDGNVWSLSDMPSLTGEQIRLHHSGTDKESDARVASFVDQLRNRKDT